MTFLLALIAGAFVALVGYGQGWTTLTFAVCGALAALAVALLEVRHRDRAEVQDRKSDQPSPRDLPDQRKS